MRVVWEYEVWGGAFPELMKVEGFIRSTAGRNNGEEEEVFADGLFRHITFLSP